METPHLPNSKKSQRLDCSDENIQQPFSKKVKLSSKPNWSILDFFEQEVGPIEEWSWCEKGEFIKDDHPTSFKTPSNDGFHNSNTKILETEEGQVTP